MERARTEWLRSFGIEQDVLLAEDGIIFAVHSVTLNFIKPGHFNELLYVTANVSQRRRASLIFHQEVVCPVNEAQQAGQIDNVLQEDMTVLCAGHVKIACLDAASMRPCHIPDHVLTEIACDS